jgi:hypothetical protein
MRNYSSPRVLSLSMIRRAAILWHSPALRRRALLAVRLAFYVGHNASEIAWAEHVSSSLRTLRSALRVNAFALPQPPRHSLYFVGR